MRSDDETVPFMILATRQGIQHTSIRFVRAKTLADAYKEALSRESGLSEFPDIRLQAFVVSIGMTAETLQLKELARFYWDFARREHESFEDAWDAHGAEPDEDDVG